MLLATSACRCCFALRPLCCLAVRGLLLLRFVAALRCGAEFPHAALLLLRCNGALRSGSALMRAAVSCCCCVPLLALKSWECPGNLRIQVLITCLALLYSFLVAVAGASRRTCTAGALGQFVEAYSLACR